MYSRPDTLPVGPNEVDGREDEIDGQKSEKRAHQDHNTLPHLRQQTM